MRTILMSLFVFLNFTLSAQEKTLEQYILNHTQQINIAETNSNDLLFLDTILKNKRIVALGESSHGTEEYSEVKLKLIRYLHEKLGFNVLLFESPMMACSYVDLIKDSTAATELIQNSIQSVWHTKTVAQLFNYIKTSDLAFKGFDPQYITSPYSSLLFSASFTDHPGIQNKLVQLEKRIADAFIQPKKYLSLKDSFSIAWSQLADQFAQLKLTPIQSWIKQMISTNITYYKNINKGNNRDILMADNIIWLAEKLYPNEKLIVWAHNTHIDKTSSTQNRIMGKLLAEHFNEQLYVIGLYMTNGTTALNNRKVLQIKSPPKNSLEELLSARGFKTAFIQTNTKLFNRNITTLHWGKDKQQFNLFKSYNAVILINGVSAPEYLKDQ